MGGYAAIKYSSKLKATHTLACCPQWSIDPSECDGNNSGYGAHFNQNLLGMGIKPADMSGHIYVIYDPLYQVDSFHFSRIKQQDNNVTGIHAQYISHHVTSMISGSNNIHEMVIAIQSDDVDALKYIVANIRRKNSIRRDNLLRQASIKHSYLTAKIIITGEFTSDLATEALWLSINAMFECGDLKKLKALTEQIEGKKSIFNSKAIANAVKILENRVKLDVRDNVISWWECGNVSTFHGTILAYDLISFKKIRQIKKGKPKYGVSLSTPVVIITSGRDRILAVIYEGEIHPLVKRGPFIEIGFLGEENEDRSLFITYSSIDDNCFTLSNNGLYLCADNKGGVVLNRVIAKEWEKFKTI